MLLVKLTYYQRHGTTPQRKGRAERMTRLLYLKKIVVASQNLKYSTNLEKIIIAEGKAIK